jgi:hypothetical protein
MTHTDDPSLTKIELIVLGRLSCSKTPKPAELGKAITSCDPEAQFARPLQEVVADTLAGLRRRGLVRVKAKKLTDEGARLLRTMFGVARTPNWEDIRAKHLPACGLGLQPGSDHARRALRDVGTLGAALLDGCLDGCLDDERSPVLSGAADALIAKLLGLEPGPLTLDRIRVQVLAREMRSELKSRPKKKTVVRLVTEETLGEALTSKGSITHALGVRGVSRLGAPNGRGQGMAQSPPPRLAAPSEPPTTLPQRHALQQRVPQQHAPQQHAVQWAPAAEAQSGPLPPLEALPADTLLTLVREAIPRIGSDGRFGPEKVFVSAIWHRIESDSRLPELSLDRFKRWLVTANRDQLLDLARADLVGAMDAELVAESEIRDLGATFHFVVDRRLTPSMGRGFHAR